METIAPNCPSCGLALSCRVCNRKAMSEKSRKVEKPHLQAAASFLFHNKCVCGRAKFHGSVACATCWDKLPRELQGALPKMLRPEFVVNLAAAQTLLGAKQTVLDAKPRQKKQIEQPAAIAVNEVA